MNPGNLNRLIDVLGATGSTDIKWERKRTVHGAVVEGKTGMIAPLAVKAPAIEAIIRETEIDEANALIFNGAHYLVTSALRDAEHPIYMKVLAVRSPVYIADIYRPVKSINNLGATVWMPAQIGSTVCCLAEKYVTQASATGHDETRSELIMVTPKLCDLTEGDSIELSSSEWKVTACYKMDRYKNQYRIERVKDN